MPTYEYQCRLCGERIEAFQRFSDKPLKVHAGCGGDLKRVFHAGGIVFKGSGYYVTDSRSNGGADPASAPSSAKSTEMEAKSSNGSANKTKAAAAAD
jgi:putative FmdB family regulatory protein